MRSVVLTAAFIGAAVLGGCATVPEAAFDTSFSRSEIAALTAHDFDLDPDAAARALRPTYKKYGAPHAYVSGFMSSVNDPTLSRLYGSGQMRAKLRRDDHTFWQINGQGLSGHLTPIKTAHLVYDVAEIGSLEDVLSSVGTLSKRAQVFTIFERHVDGQIVVTLHRTDDLPQSSVMQTLSFFEN